MIIALALSPSVDVTYEVPRLVVGDITRPTAVTRVAGGKALNVARVAHALGADVHVVAALGGAAGAWIAASLEQEGITTTVVPIATETRTCLSIVEDAESHVATDVYESATPLTSAEWERFVEVAFAVISAAECSADDEPIVIAISGSLPAGVPPEAIATLLRDLAGEGAIVAVDSSGAGLEAMIGVSDIVKVNLAEASELLGTSPVDALAACHELRARWEVAPVVTDGVRGGAALRGDAEIIIPPPTAFGRFPAGSGDAFFGGLLTGVSRGTPLADALDLAASAGQRNAMIPGQGRLG